MPELALKAKGRGQGDSVCTVPVGGESEHSVLEGPNGTQLGREEEEDRGWKTELLRLWLGPERPAVAKARRLR